MKGPYTKTPEQVLSELHSDGSGLTRKNRQSSPAKIRGQYLYREAMNLC